MLSQLPFTQGGVACCVLISIYSIGLDFALKHYCLNELAEQVYAFSQGGNPFLRANFYYILSNMAVVAYTILSLVILPDSTGIQLCLQSDTFSYIFIFGLVVFMEQSRQTPLEGFLVVRDALFYGCSLALLIFAFSQDTIPDYWFAASIGLFFIFWVFNCINSTLQYRAMKLLTMLQDERTVSPELLLTQQPAKLHYGELEDIIVDNTDKIDAEITKFRLLLERAVPNERQRKIRQNFSKIVLTFKTAVQIKRKQQVEDRATTYQRFWLPKQSEQYHSMHQYNEQDEDEEADIVEDIQAEDEEQKDENDLTEPQELYWKILKYAYFPVYLFSLAKGRLKILFYLLSLGLLFANVVLIHLSCQYLGQGTVSYKIVMIVFSQLLCISKLVYFIRLPGHADYDFCNIFLQSGFLKCSIVVPVSLLINKLMFGGTFERAFMFRYGISKGASLLVFLIFMCFRNITARKENFKYLVGIYILSLAGSLTSLTIN